MKYPIFISGQGIEGTGKVIALIICGLMLTGIAAMTYHWWRRG
jgi:hypothetical protein